jgi:hypothetical protein
MDKMYLLSKEDWQISGRSERRDRGREGGPVESGCDARRQRACQVPTVNNMGYVNQQ